MQKFGLALLLILLAVNPVLTDADMFTPSHSCSKPYKPYEFEDERAVDRFKDEVEDYQRCIDDFVEEQNDAIRKHQRAAQEAIDE
ncbi:hypothetical protein ACFL00_03110 [Pseudomonadota bacterium]